MRVAITGSAGTIGNALCNLFVKNGWIVYAIDTNENGLYYMSLDLPITPVVQDICKANFWEAFYTKNDIALTINCAACKQLPMVEQHPFWAMHVNGLALQHLQGKVIHISTDKAVYPTSLYGFSKYIGEEIAKLNDFTILRLVNVLGSRGSVTEVFEKQQAEGGPVTITDVHMIRYFTELDSVCDSIKKLVDMPMGFYMQVDHEEVSIYDIAVATGCEIKVTGIRPGEKIVEDLRYNDEQITLREGNLDLIYSPIRIDCIDELTKDIYRAEYSKYNMLKTMWKWVPEK